MGELEGEIVPIRVERRTRRYDSDRGCYVYDISFKTRAPFTERTIDVAEAFGLGIDDEREHVVYRDFDLRLARARVGWRRVWRMAQSWRCSCARA